VSPGTVSSVVSKPPTKSQRPKEEVKETSPKPVLQVRQENAEDDEKTSQPTSPAQSLTEVDLSGEDLILVEPEDLLEEKCDPTKTNQDSDGNSESLKGHSDPEPEDEPNGSVAPPETKDNALDLKDQKIEDRQSNTPSPPVSNFSSGTSTTSDIEVLDHESVISESSVSSRQEVGDAKGNLNLMQNSFQLLSPSVEYGRLDEFQKLTESCSSSDAFERIDSFSVQSLDSRSISEINSDDELPGRGCTLVAMAVSSSTPSLDVTDSTESKTDEEGNETLLMHSSDDIEMEESGRSATPVNSEQPDLLVTALQTHEIKDEVLAELQEDSSQPKVDYTLEDLQKTLDGKEELEKQHRENIRKLNSVVERQEKDVGRLQTELEEFQENNRSLQAALDSSYKELAELHKANATKASAAQEVALSCEIKAKEEMCFALERAKEESQKHQEALSMQASNLIVTDLRIALQRAEQQAARKEDYLRQEIAELQQGLQECTSPPTINCYFIYRNQVELENLKMEYKKMVEEARKEKNLLASQLEMEKMRVEQEKKKVLLAQEAVKEKVVCTCVCVTK
ncbi:hypothetical protein AB205_0027460, partial [Aquarana catesbeiana]